jgi:hypothetical protein
MQILYTSKQRIIMAISLYENGELCNTLILIYGLSGFVVRRERDIIFAAVLLLLLFAVRCYENFVLILKFSLNLDISQNTFVFLWNQAQ